MTSKPKRGSRTAKHTSVKQAKMQMAEMMHRKVHKTAAMKEKRNHSAKKV